jgi:sugar phosphate isomerase/epimerase
MRLGAPVFDAADTPELWAEAHRRAGYRAAYCPVDATAPDELIRAYADVARKNDLIIAETGAWSNSISPDTVIRGAAIRLCCAQLDLADRIGARCCVNISGSRGAQWDGPHPENLTRDTFDLVVQVVREIVDTVKPTQSYYTLETMPWAFPDSVESYAELIRAIDRKRFAVHLDPTNLVCSPQRYAQTGALIRECFEKLGPHIRSCHAKDIILSGKLTVHLDETRPGLGSLDYRVYLEELSKLDADTPLMIEHLPTKEEYDEAARHIRSVAANMGVNGL